jgi:hypothetical protein
VSAQVAAREDASLLGLLLGVLYPYFHTVLGLELPDECRIPEFACDSEIFAASHESIRLASFRSGRDAGLVEVFLFPTSH